MNYFYRLLSILVFFLFNFSHANAQSQDTTDTVKPIFEPLLIASYDSNIGIGYGLKAFFLNFLKSRESFDIILFNTTKGVRWYNFVFSIPDFELRQGKKYPLALDVNIDYNKWISYYFYGIGNQSNSQNRIKYARKLIEFNITAGRGFSDHFVGQFAIGYKTIDNSNVEDNVHANYKYLGSDPSLVKYSSAILDIRYDTRNSYINPSHGIVFQGKVEFVPEIPQNNVSFIHWTTWLQYYREIFIKRVILAMRFGLQELDGKNLPIHVLIPLGSNRTLRGYPLDRFLDKSAALFNTEIRFPIYWRFGGILGLDAGRVWGSVEKFSFNNWHSNAVLGLRYYLRTYIVRLDVGFSHETIGLYLNFGHIF